MTAASTMTAASSLSPSTAYTIHVSASGRSLSLDGLRGIAVLLVLGFHTGFPGTTIGFLGVDIFFVLSGFLITTMLAGEYQLRRRINLPKFWERRFLRLMPAYWLYVGTMTACLLWLDRSATQTAGGWSPRWYAASLWGYFVNYAPMDGIWTHQRLCIHLWSLAVEEQFYFLWPLIAALLLRYVPRPSLPAWGLFGAVVAARALLPSESLSHELYTRGNGIVLGSACALSLYDGTFARVAKWFEHAWLRRAWLGATLALFVLITLLRMRGVYSEPGIHLRFQPWFCVLFAGIVIILWSHPQSRPARMLAFGPLAYLGQISYGVYLYHLAAQYLVWQVLLNDFAPANLYLKYSVRFAAFMILTLAMAMASYHLMERPFLKLKEKLR